MKKAFILSLFIWLTFSITTAQTIRSSADSFLLNLLHGKDPMVDEVLDHPDKYQFQLLYTQIDSSNDKTVLTEYTLFQDKYYFYPASLIKFPLAITALEKLTSLYDSGVNINNRFRLKTLSCDDASNKYVNSHQNPTLAQILREMIIMSNNDAYNVFFDFTGMDYVNRRMREAGYGGILMKRRFTSGCSDTRNRLSGGFYFQRSDVSKEFILPGDSSVGVYAIDSTLPVKAGKKYLDNGKVVNEPRDYSGTNHVRLTDAHQLLISLFYPDVVAFPFKINKEYKDSLVYAMGSFPRELKNSQYDRQKIPDYYYKFFLDPQKFETADNLIRIYNKVGLASGFLSDISFFTDNSTGIRYFISAAILAKKDDIINSGKYNYYDFGIPVLRKISSLIYDYEKERRGIR